MRMVTLPTTDARLRSRHFDALRTQARILIPDRRKHRRVDTDLSGRFMRENKEEHTCRVVNMSAGSMSVLSPVVCSTGERIVAYLDVVGRIEGIVVRGFAGGFAVRILATPHKREKIVNQLTWLLNREQLRLAETRRQALVPGNPSSRLMLPNGESFECRLIDVSLNASVTSLVRPPIGTSVVLGRTHGRVVRHHETGLDVQFADLQEPDGLARAFGEGSVVSTQMEAFFNFIWSSSSN